MEVLDVLNLRMVVARLADDGDDIEAMRRFDVLVVEVMVDGGQEIVLLRVVYG